MRHVVVACIFLSMFGGTVWCAEHDVDDDAPAAEQLEAGQQPLPENPPVAQQMPSFPPAASPAPTEPEKKVEPAPTQPLTPPAPEKPAEAEAKAAMPLAPKPELPQPQPAAPAPVTPTSAPLIQMPPKPAGVTPLPPAQPAALPPAGPAPAAPLIQLPPKPMVATPLPAAAAQPPITAIKPGGPAQMPLKPGGVPAQPVAPTKVKLTQPQLPGAAPVQKSAGAPEAEEEKTEGIDTIDLEEPSGNWLYKRIWWEKAESKYEKIRGLVDRIFEGRMTFFTQRTELDRSVFDPFYLSAGLGRGELEELLNYLMSEMESQRSKVGSLNEEERAFLNLMTQEKETLEQLRVDIEAISKIDGAIDDALSKLMEQLNLCRSYEQKAWQAFKEIAQVLNDKKARELYYAMVTYEDNIAAIGNYIRTPFADHFNKLMGTAKEHVARIQATIQKLKEKGIDFKKKAQELENQVSAEERERMRREKEEAIERAREQALAEQSWSHWFVGLFKSAWSSVTGAASSAYSTVMGWFGKAPAEEEVEQDTATAKPSNAAESERTTETMPEASTATVLQSQVPGAPALPPAPVPVPAQPLPHDE